MFTLYPQLSILFMRFRNWNTRDNKRVYNFQFSLWDSFSIFPFFHFFPYILSILFMRFQFSNLFLGFRCVSFNSLYEIQFTNQWLKVETITFNSLYEIQLLDSEDSEDSEDSFQFSLWDSRRNSVSLRILSIYFQFSLWDSLFA